RLHSPSLLALRRINLPPDTVCGKTPQGCRRKLIRVNPSNPRHPFSIAPSCYLDNPLNFITLPLSVIAVIKNVMKIEIDTSSGFCFGVTNAIEMAEDVLNNQKTLYCLGDIVHNNEEVKRLESLGLITINHEQYKNLKDTTVLIRAHGEPPATYEIARKNNIHLIDATCPVVIRLQERIKSVSDKIRETGGQIVIFGKHGHAEVVGLMGQTSDTAIVVMDADDLNQIDVSIPVHLFSQTTMYDSAYNRLKRQIENRMRRVAGHTNNLMVYDTICPRVSGREPDLAKFAREHDVIIFVSGKKSSNGKMLFDVCKLNNTSSYFVSTPAEIKKEWFINAESVGVSGATSTPKWLMQQVAKKIINTGC
ncbi:MAG: 4-hydroxy-3-methylbut-2-enyl diphosphate reductase, partial [Bacteroidales bacterium]